MKGIKLFLWTVMILISGQPYAQEKEDPIYTEITAPPSKIAADCKISFIEYRTITSNTYINDFFVFLSNDTSIVCVYGNKIIEVEGNIDSITIDYLATYKNESLEAIKISQKNVEKNEHEFDVVRFIPTINLNAIIKKPRKVTENEGVTVFYNRSTSNLHIAIGTQRGDLASIYGYPLALPIPFFQSLCVDGRNHIYNRLSQYVDANKQKDNSIIFHPSNEEIVKGDSSLTITKTYLLNLCKK